MAAALGVAGSVAGVVSALKDVADYVGKEEGRVIVELRVEAGDSLALADQGIVGSMGIQSAEEFGSGGSITA